MSVIAVKDLGKVYPVPVKQPGWQGTFNHFFRRTYRYVEAVKSVSFQIEPGEIVGFLGPNGAGKTTTLKMLTGLIYPSKGELRVAGHEPFQRRGEFLQQITLVMGQKQQLIWDLPALDSLRINGAVYQIPEAELEARIGELTELLDLKEKLRQPVRKLSLGERMKAELMAALLHRPQVLFLDEPTLGLDVNAQVSVRRFLQEYNRRYGSTILLTSHYMADITALCKRVLLIYAGELIYDGDLDQLLERFAPYREVKIDLAHGYPVADLQGYGELCYEDQAQPDHQADQPDTKLDMVRILVQREQLTQTVGRLLAELQVVDLTVTDPPIEEVIGRVFQTGKV